MVASLRRCGDVYALTALLRTLVRHPFRRMTQGAEQVRDHLDKIKALLTGPPDNGFVEAV